MMIDCRYCGASGVLTSRSPMPDAITKSACFVCGGAGQVKLHFATYEGGFHAKKMEETISSLMYERGVLVDECEDLKKEVSRYEDLFLGRKN